MTVAESLITYDTKLSVKEVMQRLEKLLREKNVTIFAKISHSQAAKDAGLKMQDEELIIFGNPKVGTALMLENPAIGIELPLKVIVWKSNHKTLVAYQNLDKLVDSFDIKKSVETVTNLKNFMKNLVEAAIQ